MNPDIKNLWLTALRSGDFRQGKRKLRSSNDDYCCLGVLCELAVQNNVIPAPQLSPNNDRYVYDGSGGILPDSVKEWAELDSNSPMVTASTSGVYNVRNTLAYFNDDDVPFTEIADIIERNL